MFSRALATTFVVAAAFTAACDKSAPVTPTAPSQTSPPSQAAPPPVVFVPPPTQLRTISGVVQTRDGVPMPGVTITPATGGQYVSDASGAFHFPYPATDKPSACYLMATAAGFEERQIAWGLGLDDVTLHAFFLVPRITMATTGQRDGMLRPDDLGWWAGEAYDSQLCWPCNRVHIAAEEQSRVRISVSWQGTAPLQLWVNGQARAPIAGADGNEATGEIMVGPGSDTTVLVGINEYPRRQELSAPIAYRMTTTTLPR